jgi:hypothetical protein
LPAAQRTPGSQIFNRNARPAIKQVAMNEFRKPAPRARNSPE